MASHTYHRARKNNPKIYIYPQKTQNCQSDCEEKELSWRHNSPRVHILQTYSNDNSVVLAQKQIYGSTIQNREPGNKPVHLWLIIFNKGGKNIQWRKESLFSKRCWERWTDSYKIVKVEYSLTSYIKINSK